MKNLIRRILKEDLEYWGVTDASPEKDKYIMGIDEDITDDGVNDEEEQKDKYIEFITNNLVKHSIITSNVLRTPFGSIIPLSSITKKSMTLDRQFINDFYNYLSDNFGVDIEDGSIVEPSLSLYLEKVWVKDINESDTYHKDINEGVPIYKSHNLPKQMYLRLRDHYPTTPEYVIKDYFYNVIIPNIDFIKKERYGDPLLLTVGSWDNYLKGPWKLEILSVNPEDFDDTTVNAFIERDFGNVDTYQVPDDDERMRIQKKIATPNGMNEPVIVERLSNGKYKLLEGWHRTMSILLLGDNGEDIKNWDKVKIRAFVRDLSK